MTLRDAIVCQLHGVHGPYILTVLPTFIVAGPIVRGVEVVLLVSCAQLGRCNAANVVKVILEEMLIPWILFVRDHLDRNLLVVRDCSATLGCCGICHDCQNVAVYGSLP